MASSSSDTVYLPSDYKDVITFHQKEKGTDTRVEVVGHIEMVREAEVLAACDKYIRDNASKSEEVLNRIGALARKASLKSTKMKERQDFLAATYHSNTRVQQTKSGALLKRDVRDGTCDPTQQIIPLDELLLLVVERSEASMLEALFGATETVLFTEGLVRGQWVLDLRDLWEQHVITPRRNNSGGRAAAHETRVPTSAHSREADARHATPAENLKLLLDDAMRQLSTSSPKKTGRPLKLTKQRSSNQSLKGNPSSGSFKSHGSTGDEKGGAGRGGRGGRGGPLVPESPSMPRPTTPSPRMDVSVSVSVSAGVPESTPHSTTSYVSDDAATAAAATTTTTAKAFDTTTLIDLRDQQGNEDESSDKNQEGMRKKHTYGAATSVVQQVEATEKLAADDIPVVKQLTSDAIAEWEQRNTQLLSRLENSNLKCGEICDATGSLVSEVGHALAAQQAARQHNLRVMHQRNAEASVRIMHLGNVIDQSLSGKMLPQSVTKVMQRARDQTSEKERLKRLDRLADALGFHALVVEVAKDMHVQKTSPALWRLKALWMTQYLVARGTSAPEKYMRSMLKATLASMGPMYEPTEKDETFMERIVGLGTDASSVPDCFPIVGRGKTGKTKGLVRMSTQRLCN